MMAVRIPIGQYLVTSNAHNWIINVRGGKEGKERWCPTWYYTSIPDLCMGLFEHVIRDCGAEGLDELHRAITDAYALIREMRAVITSNLKGD